MSAPPIHVSQPAQEKYDPLHQRQRIHPVAIHQPAFHQQAQYMGRAGSVVAHQLIAPPSLQAYVAFNQKDSHSDGVASATADVEEAGNMTSERSCSSRGSSVGADVGVIDDEGRFISSLMSAQHASMRVYV